MEQIPRQVATCIFQGRTGNTFFQIAQLIAYAKKHGMLYFIPDEVPHAPGKRPYFNVQSTGPELGITTLYQEPANEHGKAYYHEIRLLENPKFEGYWQSFKYFDDYREDILAAFNLPYKKTGYVSIHVRRSDYLVECDNFPPLPLEYYQKATDYFTNQGHIYFKVFSDDINWCKETFNMVNFPNCLFLFSDGKSEVEDLIKMSNCQYNIVANSSFSFVAAWLNQNPDKVVLCPTRERMFTAMNADMIPNYFTQIHV